jgi:hypothetical protein
MERSSRYRYPSVVEVAAILIMARHFMPWEKEAPTRHAIRRSDHRLEHASSFSSRTEAPPSPAGPTSSSISRRLIPPHRGVGRCSKRDHPALPDNWMIG